MRGKLEISRLEEIKEEVTFMYEETDVHSLPIDCFEIARRLKYVLIPYSTLEFNAFIDAYGFDPDGFSKVELNPITGMWQYVIYYNDLPKDIGRIRWTVFHEIGHCYLGHHDNVDNSQSEIEEAEANFFAKYAIAPPAIIFQLDTKSPQVIHDVFLTTDEEAGYAYDYYEKWFQFGPPEYTGYERRQLEAFLPALARLRKPIYNFGATALDLSPAMPTYEPEL